MANQEHLAILKQGIETWNAWRRRHVDVEPDFSNADLHGWNLRGGYFSGANLSGADLSEADLRDAELGWVGLDLDYQHAPANLSFALLEKADCRNARLSLVKPISLHAKEALFTNADLSWADLSHAEMSETDMRKAKMGQANLTHVDLRKADLREADLSGVRLHSTNLIYANLTGCRVAGIDAQSVHLWDTIQIDLNISIFQLAPIIVDSLQIAQFVNLYRGNPVLQDVLDIGPSTKLVLLVGGFGEKRKHILEAFKTALRQREIIPIFYDITQEKKRNINDLLRELVSLVRFVLVDVSEPAPFLQALEPILPALPAVPLHMIMQAPEEERVREAFFKTYPWIAEPQLYNGADDIADVVRKYL